MLKTIHVKFAPFHVTFKTLYVTYGVFARGAHKHGFELWSFPIGFISSLGFGPPEIWKVWEM